MAGTSLLIGTEVTDVLRTLRSNGIEVTEIHDHMLTETQRIIFKQFWANDGVIKLAMARRVALDKIASAKSWREMAAHRLVERGPVNLARPARQAGPHAADYICAGCLSLASRQEGGLRRDEHRHSLEHGSSAHSAPSFIGRPTAKKMSLPDPPNTKALPDLRLHAKGDSDGVRRIRICGNGLG